MNKKCVFDFSRICAVLLISFTGFMRTSEVQQVEKNRQLFEAIDKGWPPKAIGVLLSQGADPNAIDEEDQQSVLGRALTQYPRTNPKIYENVIRFLLEAKADPDYQDPSSGRTPLGLVLESEPISISLLSLLLEHGVDVNKLDIFGTPLEVASRNTNASDEVIKLLLKYGARLGRLNDPSINIDRIIRLKRALLKELKKEKQVLLQAKRDFPDNLVGLIAEYSVTAAPLRPYRPVILKREGR